jgi:hypothetical protein
MGYTTDFEGSLSITPSLTMKQTVYINQFSESRRMKRDVNILQELYKGKHSLDGDYGVEGEFFNQDIEDRSVLDYNTPPKTQPGLWCQWIINDNGELEWDGGEKFYNYVEWLEYLINNFFKKWGVVLNGSIRWRGDSFDDIGTIKVNDNVVSVIYGF